MALKHEPTAPYHSAQDALRVLETVARHTTGVTDTELARLTGLTPERLTTLLRMLRREGYIEQITDGAYVTGDALTRLGSAQGREQALRDKLQRTLDRLRDSVGAAVYLSRYVDGEVKIAQYADGPTTPVVNEWVDFRYSAHATAIGKSLLGQLDHNSRRDHLSRHFQSKEWGSAGRRRIRSLTLRDVRAIHASGQNADQRRAPRRGYKARSQCWDSLCRATGCRAAYVL